MNKIKYYFILTVASVSLFSCSKSDSASVEPLRDYTVQYKADIADIKDYLEANTFTVTDAPGTPADQDINIEAITKPEQKSIYSYLNSPTFPSLRSKIVKLHGIEYTLYFLMLREGVGESPCSVDGVLTSYKGTYLYRKPAVSATEPSVVTAFPFEEVVFPQDFFNMYTLAVKGWGETFPNFKAGTIGGVVNGVPQYNDFGAGVMFLPSGLAYYGSGSAAIPAYAPLIFSFKLYAIKRLDHDGDGILSYLEDNGDGYLRDMRNKTDYPGNDINPDDTDKDGIPDFLDIDDDGDGIATKVEIKRPDIIVNGVVKSNGYYPFNGAAEDDPLTKDIDERQGIPAYLKESKTFDYTSPNRTRVHLDNTYPLKK